MSVHVFRVKVFISGARSDGGELMIVLTNQFPKQAIEIYLRRWEIENLFQSLKGRGVRFEETHMTHPERIAKLMGLLAVGFAWAHKVGEWRALQKAIPFKKFRHFQTLQQTYFKYGLEFMRETLLQIFDKDKRILFKKLIDILRPGMCLSDNLITHHKKIVV